MAQALNQCSTEWCTAYNWDACSYNACWAGAFADWPCTCSQGQAKLVTGNVTRVNDVFASRTEVRRPS